jgi:hypothetical protein
VAACATLLRPPDKSGIDGRGLLLTQAFGRVYLTLDGGFLTPLSCPAPLGVLGQPPQAFLFTLGCRALTLVGKSLAPVGLQLTLVGKPFPLVGDMVALVGEPLATLQFCLSTLQREVALVSSDISTVGFARRVSAAFDVHDPSSVNGRS